MRPEYPTDGDSAANIKRALAEDENDGSLSDDEVESLLEDLEE